MDFNQQLSAFREWALHFDGPSQKWMWSAIAILVGYGFGALVSKLLRFIARKLAGLAKHKEGDAQPKTADHVMIDILGALIRAAFLLVSLAIAANLLFNYSLDEARALAVSALKGLAILVGVWFVGSWLGSRVRKFGHKVGRRATSGGETLFNFLAALVRFGAFAIGLIAALQQFGFDTASLLASFLGTGIGTGDGAGVGLNVQRFMS